MIFVTVGTCEPFDRLMHAVDAFEVDEPVIVQTGLSRVIPHRAETVDFLPYHRLLEIVRQARVVVTHAGVGSVLTSLLNGIKPIVVPRLQRYGEAVDDHQLELAIRLEELDLVTLVQEASRLSEVICDDPADAKRLHAGTALIHELREFIAS